MNRWFLGVGLFVCTGCGGDDFDVLVSIQDPLGIAVEATTLRLGETLGQLESRELGGLEFNVTIPVRAPGVEGVRSFWVEAYDAGGGLLARGMTPIDFGQDKRVELNLRALCDQAQLCPAPVETNVCCVGPDLCVGRDEMCPMDSIPTLIGFALQMDVGARAATGSFRVDPTGGADDGLTVEAWIAIQEACSAPGGCEGAILNKSGEYSLQLQSDGGFYRLRSRITSETGQTVPESVTTIADTDWHHVAVTYDGQTVTLYLDGVVVATTLLTGRLERGTQDFVLGSMNTPFLVDEVRVWSYARTESQILSALNAPLPGDQAGLVLYWNMDEGEGNLAEDVTGNGNTLIFDQASSPLPGWVRRDF